MLERGTTALSTTLTIFCIALSPAASGRAAAQTPTATPTPTAKAAQNTDPNATMTLTGCLMKESDYRKAHNLGAGAINGVGLGDEFVLVDAAPAAAAAASTQTPPTKPSASGSPCREAGNGQAYRITGHLEDRMKAFAGHRLQVTGKFDNAHDAQIAAGQATAKLPPEIEVSSYQEVTASADRTATAQTPSQTPSQSAAPASVQARNEPNRNAPQDNRGGLPRTASHQPLIALSGLLLLCVALVLRVTRGFAS